MTTWLARMATRINSMLHVLIQAVIIIFSAAIINSKNPWRMHQTTIPTNHPETITIATLVARRNGEGRSHDRLREMTTMRMAIQHSMATGFVHRIVPEKAKGDQAGDHHENNLEMSSINRKWVMEAI